jgi:hypothetical protein
MSEVGPRTEEELIDWLASNPNNDQILALQDEARKLVAEGKGNSYLSLLTWRMIHKATLQVPVEDRLLLAGLEETWIDLINEGDTDWSETQREARKNVLSAFQNDWDSGLYPAPEILSAMSEVVSYYLNMDGAISLDEAFFGFKHNKRTSYATKSMSAVYESFNVDIQIDILSRYDDQQTLGEKALIFIEKSEIHRSKLKDMDLDTFLKGFRRFRGGSPIPVPWRIRADIQNSKKK